MRRRPLPSERAQVLYDAKNTVRNMDRNTIAKLLFNTPYHTLSARNRDRCADVLSNLRVISGEAARANLV